MRVKIGDFLKPVRKAIAVQPDVEYKQVTIRMNNQGACLRGTKKGSEIKTKKQFLVEPGQFILSKIDARNGAFGLVPEDLAGAIVTQDFPTYSINHQIIDKDYLVLLSGSKFFVDLMKKSSSGTTNRKRLKEEKFLNIEIELPEIQKQRLVVQKLKLVIEKEFLIQAEIDRNKKILAQISSRLFSLKTFDVKTENLGDYLLDISYGISVSAKPVEHSDDVRLLRITDIQNNTVKWDSVPTFSTQNSVKDSQLLGDGDIVIARTGGTIGKSFLISEMSHKAVYASYLIRLRTKKNELNPRFLSFFLNSDLYWKQLHAKKRGTGQPNVNSQVLKSIKIPVPTIEQQTKLIEDFDLFSKKNNLLLSLLNKQSNILSQLLLKSSKKEGV